MTGEMVMERVPAGYKKTELGTIPEDWRIQSLRLICTPSKERVNPITSSQNYRCIELEHLSQGTGRLLGFIDSKRQLSLKAVFKTGDVLFGKLRPYLRKYWFAEFNGVCTTEIWVLKNDQSCFNKYLYYLVQSKSISEAADRSTGTKMPRAEWNIVGETLIPLPPLEEQTAIANALSDVDSLIQSLEKLIEKKKNVKKGAMQELLTGKRRLPGFERKKGYKKTEVGTIPKDWEVRTLQKVSTFITKGATPTTYGFQWKDFGILFLRSECVSKNGLDLSQSMFISEKAHHFLNRGEVGSGDLLMTITGNVGRVILLGSSFGVANINQHIARIRVNREDTNRQFVMYYLSQAKIRRYYESITTGQAYPQISLTQVRNTSFPLPPLEEQAAIANVLSDMDDEINALESKLGKYKEIKKGMMQELLTGRTRLI